MQHCIFHDIQFLLLHLYFADCCIVTIPHAATASNTWSFWLLYHFCYQVWDPSMLVILDVLTTVSSVTLQSLLCTRASIRQLQPPGISNHRNRFTHVERNCLPGDVGLTSPATQHTIPDLCLPCRTASSGYIVPNPGISSTIARVPWSYTRLISWPTPLNSFFFMAGAISFTTSCTPV